MTDCLPAAHHSARTSLTTSLRCSIAVAANSCRRLSALLAAGLLLLIVSDTVCGDGPADNLPANVRRIPKEGIPVPPERQASLRAGLQKLQQQLQTLQESPDAATRSLLPDVMIFERAVRCALDDNEFFDVRDLDKADRLLAEGSRRAEQLQAGQPAWTSQTGLVVRGYISRLDNTVQPYGLVIPRTYDLHGSVPVRCDIWFHGRGETLSEVNFLSERMQSPGQFTPDDTIVLHPYGRYCNAFKFAGEVDVLEGLADVQQRYRIDAERISVRGFSMGGAACWQFATHYPDRWFAANPGAGFSETPRFLNVFQGESLQPTAWEKTLWSLYDCDKYALNLMHCPTIAYSGELDKQKQAADVMEEALRQHGVQLRHIIGLGMGHKYDEGSKQIVDAGLAALARQGRHTNPAQIAFTTHTLKYNRQHWLTVDGLREHWQPATVRARVVQPGADPGTDRLTIELTVANVSAFSLNFPPGSFPLGTAAAPERLAEARLIITATDDPAAQAGDGDRITVPRPQLQQVTVPGVYSDGSLNISVHLNTNGRWSPGAPQEPLRKQRDLQGPIDDAFMDSFVFVRPTGTAQHAAVEQWAAAELQRAIEHWRRHFRGDARVVNDTDVTDELVQSANLVLWGDPQSNSVIRRIADKLPVQWTADSIVVGPQSYAAASHAPILIYPNPLHPQRYVVLNSSFTFREYAYLNNARQVPMLPDWAVISLDTPPNAVWPGKVVAADFFDERWQLKP